VERACSNIWTRELVGSIEASFVAVVSSGGFDAFRDVGVIDCWLSCLIWAWCFPVDRLSRAIAFPTTPACGSMSSS
jgi:hypothetical protein